jgi:hypothetical protein
MNKNTETVAAEKSLILKQYEDADEKGKKMLKLLYPDLFPKEPMERINSFKDACSDLKLKTHGDAYKVLKLDRKLLAETPIEQCDDACLRLMIIAHALNEGHIFTKGENRWVPSFKLFPSSGFALSDSYYDYVYGHSYVGSLLSYVDEERANHAGKIAVNEYKQLMTQ